MTLWHKFFLKDVSALIGGMLLVLAFAPYEIFPLAILSPAVLLLLIEKESLKRASILGFEFGLGLFGAGVYWVFISIHEFGDVPDLIAGFITVAMAAILALYPAAACYATKRYFPTSDTVQRVFAFPAIWVFAEWARSWLFTGFPWLFIGYSQTNSPLKGYAPLLSVYGVSLVALMGSGLLVSALRNYQQKDFRRLYLLLFAFFSLWIAGGLFCLIPWSKPIGPAISVSLVQGDIPQSLKWSPEHLELSFDRYTSLTQPLWGKSDLIIWPEAAIPMTYQDSLSFIQDMDDKALKSHTQLILGIPMQASTPDSYYNAVITLGSVKQSYYKRHLAPFGEYIPLQPLANRVFDFLKIPMAGTIPGKQVQDPFTLNGTKIQPNICYEVAFPELIHTFDPSIGVLLTVTNDAWFGHSTAEAQHLQMAQMRAIELGRPLLFVSNDGITAIIGPTGKIEERAPTHVPYVLTGHVQPTTGITPWMNDGIDSILMVLIVLLFVARRHRRAIEHVIPETVATSTVN